MSISFLIKNAGYRGFCFPGIVLFDRHLLLLPHYDGLMKTLRAVIVTDELSRVLGVIQVR